METIVQFGIDAVSNGAIYALIALGLGVTFGVMGLINFAYGELITAAGFTMVLLRDEPWPVLVLGTVVVVVGVSVATERVAFRPLRGANATTLLLASFAVSVILQNLARTTIGGTAKGVRPYESLSSDFALGGVRIERLDLLAVTLAIGMGTCFWYVLARTRLGMEIRAAAEDAQMATILGVKSDRVLRSAFAISGVLAAVGGLVLIFQAGSVSPTTGMTPVLTAFVAIVVGGMGSLLGAAVGGFLLGSASSLIGATLPVGIAPFRDAVLFAFVLLVLAVRPQGLIAGPPERV